MGLISLANSIYSFFLSKFPTHFYETLKIQDMIYAFFEFWIFDKWISFKLGKVFSIWTNLQKNEPNYCPSTFQPAHEIVSRFSKIFLPNFYFFILPGRSFQLRSKYLDQKIASMNNCLFKKKSCKGQKISEAILQKKISFFCTF